MKEFVPDYRNIVDAAKNKTPKRYPLYEHGIHWKTMEKILGVEFADMFWAKDKKTLKQFMIYNNEFYKKMGYDTVTWELGICASFPGNGALGAHQPGAIHNRKDYDSYSWDGIADDYFARWGTYFETLRETMPEGMMAIGGVGNGVFEIVQDIVGYQNLCLISADDPELYQLLFQRVGDVWLTVWKRFIKEFGDIFCVLRFGDDLGYKSATMLPPDHVRKYIIPQYKRIVDVIHSYNKPFLLHSCGCIFDVMEDIINIVKIDAKHSNEDVIAPFKVWMEKYGSRIGNFGGIDMDELCQRTPEEIKKYTLNICESARPYGGIAFGSGNSIPDYVPLAGYKAMVDTVRQWRGDF